MKTHFPIIAISALLMGITNLKAQQDAPTPTNAAELMESTRQLEAMRAGSFVRQTKMESLGPSIMSGRVVDLDVNPDNPEEFYVAYATAGVWYTHNNGTTFEPIMDNAPTQNVGDIAVHWPSGLIWVGTGENNASRSSYAGIGMLKSSDRGRSWSHAGLSDSHHIGRIRINPDNPEEVTVAVAGHLYTPNAERGIYRTEDGGQTWQRTLYVNASTGAIDLDVVPGNYDIQYAATWEKDRKAWNFTGSGPGSAIYKSEDGGKTWGLLSTQASGFPVGDGVGRIGLAVFDRNTVYAVLDNQARRPSEEEKRRSKDLQSEDFAEMSKKDFLKIKEKELNRFLRSNRFPREYDAGTVIALVESDSIRPSDLKKYLSDANSELFDTPVIGGEVYVSRNGGKNWEKTHEGYIEDFFYSYGYYFGQIRVSPGNKDEIYILGVPILKSLDGGSTFSSIDRENVHADHHALWVNPVDGRHLINGNDGGVNISYDQGDSWIKNNSPKVGQFYSVTLDNDKPYNIYGGLQDNGVWRGGHDAPENKAWKQRGEYPWKSLMGGDGMQVQVDNRTSSRVYTGYQFGNYFRLELNSGKRTYIKPTHRLGESPLRFNWETPILLSPHNQDVLYLGSQRLHRSFDRGDTWEAISGDLTAGGKAGNVPFGTLTAIAESLFSFGLLYAGSDDGQLHMSPNGGDDWKLVSKCFPKGYWISSVVASSHKRSRVYASVNGYRNDDFDPYIYRSEDYGKTWDNIWGNLPASPVNVVVEDPTNENVLYAGTDQGLYVSFDQGGKWNLMSNGMPAVPVHDIAIQARDKDLIAATHGRSMYRADIEHLQQVDSTLLARELHLFDIKSIRYRSSWGNRGNAWRTSDPPSVDVYFYTLEAGSYDLTVTAEDGFEVYSETIEAMAGMQKYEYRLLCDEKGIDQFKRKMDMEIQEGQDGLYHLPKGKYTVKLSGSGNKEEVELRIE